MKFFKVLLIGLLFFLLAGCASKVLEQSVPPDQIEGPSMSRDDEVSDLSGYWEGVLTISPTNSLKIGFTLTVSEELSYDAMMQIPSQGLKNFAVSSVRLVEDTITIGIDMLQATYSGTFVAKDKQIVGTFTQMGQSLPLVLSLGELHEDFRSQDPRKPYPYISEDITFTQSPEGFLLAGTITRPEGVGPFPAVVLISGSGPQNRDEALLGHRPFLVLADALTRAGIVVLRYDDRGFAESEGDASAATSLDFADDAESAVNYLQNLSYVDTGRIGLIGHSEGAIIAPIVAQRTGVLDFLVLMAGSGVDGLAVLKDQSAAILRAQKIPEEVIAEAVSTNLAIYHTILDESRTLEDRKASVYQTMLDLGLSPDQVNSQISALFSPWYMTFLTLKPSDYLKDLDIPVMILNGSKDTQVSADLNVPAIEAALLSGGNRQFTTRVYDGLNHLFQPAVTGAPDEYSSIETTIDPIVLEDIPAWIMHLK